LKTIKLKRDDVYFDKIWRETRQKAADNGIEQPSSRNDRSSHVPVTHQQHWQRTLLTQLLGIIHSMKTSTFRSFIVPDCLLLWMNLSLLQFHQQRRTVECDGSVRSTQHIVYVC